MKKYFLHNGTESSGPFSFEELKKLKITPKTPVWFEGMEKWKYAKDIDDLEVLFPIVPPPLVIEKKEEDSNEIDADDNEKSFVSKYRFIIWTIVVLVIFTIGFNFMQNQRSQELEEKNKKTELENEQYLIQQKEIEKQKLLLEEQEKKEAERNKIAVQQHINERIKIVESEIAVLKDNLETTNDRLIEANSFKFLRTASEKADEINAIKTEIKNLKIALEKAVTESNRLHLELDKVK